MSLTKSLVELHNRRDLSGPKSSDRAPVPHCLLRQPRELPTQGLTPFGANTDIFWIDTYPLW